jgi:outer membrane protein OmpA-like peptidoglycan-associated protein
MDRDRMTPMTVRSLGPAAFAALLAFSLPAARAADIQPHRALYILSLGSAKSASGVLGASGAMTYEWGETCGGWTVEQRFRLRVEYADEDASEVTSNLVTWEAKDGSRYRFNERRLRNGQLDEEIRGEAHLNVPESYMLGFESGSTSLNTGARATVEQAADASRREPSHRVLVISHASGATGVKAEDEKLSRQRAEAVRAELIHDGIPATAVKVATGASGTAANAAAQETPGRPPEHAVEIYLEPRQQGGVAEFTKPEQSTIPLKPDVLFPTAHTLYLIDRAIAGDSFVVRNVFDGTSVDDASMVSAVIGAPEPPGSVAADPDAIKSPLLERTSWKMRLAFFPAESKSDEPDYELSMRLVSNGVSESMGLDYGDYVVDAKLARLEPLPKPAC